MGQHVTPSAAWANGAAAASKPRRQSHDSPSWKVEPLAAFHPPPGHPKTCDQTQPRMVNPCDNNHSCTPTSAHNRASQKVCCIRQLPGHVMATRHATKQRGQGKMRGQRFVPRQEVKPLSLFNSARITRIYTQFMRLKQVKLMTGESISKIIYII